jgi:hypothetical protein
MLFLRMAGWPLPLVYWWPLLCNRPSPTDTGNIVNSGALEGLGRLHHGGWGWHRGKCVAERCILVHTRNGNTSGTRKTVDPTDTRHNDRTIGFEFALANRSVYENWSSISGLSVWAMLDIYNETQLDNDEPENPWTATRLVFSF